MNAADTGNPFHCNHAGLGRRMPCDRPFGSDAPPAGLRPLSNAAQVER
jgi:hypothetical protein